MSDADVHDNVDDDDVVVYDDHVYGAGITLSQAVTITNYCYYYHYY